jgi:crossover junction endodeoxyribonuclease RuvC
VAVVAIEGYSFGSKNGRELAGGLGELIRWTLWDGGYQQFTVPPTTLKSYVCSRGGAPKELMLREVYRKWGYEATDNNDADAFALAKLAHASRQTPMTQQVQTIMEKILHPTKKARKRADVRT